MAEPVWCCGVIVEAANPHWLPCMPYLTRDWHWGLEHMTRCMVGGGTWLPCHTLWRSRMNSLGYCRFPFGLIQYRPSTICHSYWMCIKCFSTLRCYGWVYGCILMPYYMCRLLGWILGKLGLWLSMCDVVVSLLRLQTPIDCIPHPYWMYTKSFSTLRCCGWAYGCIIIAVLHVQVGGDFRENEVWPSLYDVAVSWLRLKTPIDCIPHPYWMYSKC